MKQLTEEYGANYEEKTEVLKKNLPQKEFSHHKSQSNSPGLPVRSNSTCTVLMYHFHHNHYQKHHDLSHQTCSVSATI
jgi:hypothetical protein